LRALITGYGGFAATHLARHLLAITDWQLWGTVFRPEERDGRPVDGVTALAADLRDPGSAREAVARAAPDVVFHLAGQAFVPAAWDDPWATFETNVRMQLNLLEALARRPVRVVAITSNEVYGRLPESALPVDESGPLAPLNPYATSKAAQDLVAAQYAATGRDIVRVRPFNHIGPGQDDRFVVASFARQLAEAEAGRREPVIRVGDLSARRDFTDVRDMVCGYALAARDGRSGEVYNLGSGVARPVREVLETLLALATVPVAVEEDPARRRPSDVPVTLCDAGKARRELGWEPVVPFEETIADTLGYWRERVRHDARQEADAHV
jgi:GDP-4-dehydro-6-deoxy-D-mannose reductase